MAHLAHLHLTPFQFELLILYYGETEELRQLLEDPIKAILAAYCFNQLLLWAELPCTADTKRHLLQLAYSSRSKIRALPAKIR